jgi:7-carboxy-7-deazaguanine synthase (Cx14CxxC type)
MYLVKEIFYSLQGEGARAGRPSVFCRFAGCNLWSGREAHRSVAVCKFCDTDFVGTNGEGGGRYTTARDLSQAILVAWRATEGSRYVVLTGGEPLLQVDTGLIERLHTAGFEVAVETNGTQPVPPGVDWLCVSPKAGSIVTVRSGDELKVIFPQDGLSPDDVVNWDFRHRYLQPCDGPDVLANTDQAVAHCKSDARWSLSIQTHKYLAIQ